MPHANNANTSSHVGIFMENGSGDFVSGLCLMPVVFKHDIN